MKVMGADSSTCKVLITGFFDRNNWGDDLFKWSYEKIFQTDHRFKKITPLFVTTDGLREEHFKNIDVVLLGGGDVLNDYFIDRIEHYMLITKCKAPILAFSAGVPYANTLKDGKLDNLSFVMVRARRDVDLLKKRYKYEGQYAYHPDIAVLLPNLIQSNTQQKEKPKNNTKKKIGLCLARPLVKDNKEGYTVFCNEVAQSLDQLMNENENLEVVMIPFNTFSINQEECDYVVNNDVYALLSASSKARTEMVNTTLSIEEMYNLFTTLDLVIVQRFHAHLLSMVTNVPIVPIGISQKTTNLLQDLNYPLRNTLTTRKSNKAYGINKNLFVETVQEYLFDEDKRSQARSHYKTYLNVNQNTKFIDTLYDKLITSKTLSKLKVSAKLPSTMEVVYRVATCLVQAICEKPMAKHVDDVIYNAGAIGRLVQKFKQGKLTNEFLASIVCYEAVKTPCPKYHFGLAEKILAPSFRLLDDLRWIWHDYTSQQFVEAPKTTLAKGEPLFNMTVLGIEDFEGVHRSGWKYVLGGLLSNHGDDANLILDNYVDRTFHWARDIYKFTKVIPYTQPWCGFIHHTSTEHYTRHNLIDLFKDDLFRASLPHCKSLFVLSDYLKHQVEFELKQLNFDNVKVNSFVHPTEFPRVEFSYDAYMNNDKKRIIQIGAWLRDTFAIYSLTPAFPIQKTILVGSNMNHYVIPDNFKLTIEGEKSEHVLDQYVTRESVKQYIQSTNKFTTGFIDYLLEIRDSVEKIEMLSNDDYDEVLSKNVVFLKLIDASATNTIIECVVRSTPVLVNKHPAVVEYLGETYPMYYESQSEANKKAGDPSLVLETHSYLKKMDKTKFHLEYFVSDVARTIKEL
jgi:polysaccharide pyruvyl transferase WcaK-like protein